MILKNRFIVVNPNFRGQSEGKYSEILSVYNIQNGNKEQLVKYLDGLNIAYLIITIFLGILILKNLESSLGKRRDK